MTDRELMQQAMEALELLAWYENPATKVQVRKPRNGGPIVTIYPHKVATEAAAPLRERLAQPEHTKKYVTEWVGLTEEEVDECYYWKGRQWTTDELVRHVEAKLKEKNA